VSNADPTPPPELEVVGSSAAAEEAPEHESGGSLGLEPSEASEDNERSRGGWLVFLLAIALAVGGVVLANQFQRTRQLESQLGATAAELESAQAALRVYEARMSDVRGSVGSLHSQISALSSQLGELQTLVSEESLDAATTPSGR